MGKRQGGAPSSSTGRTGVGSHFITIIPLQANFNRRVGTTHLSDAQLIAGLSHSLCQNPLCSVSQEPRTQLIVGHSESRSQRSFASPMLSAESPVCLSSPWGAWSHSSSSCVSTSHPPSHAHMLSGCRAGVGFFLGGRNSLPGQIKTHVKLNLACRPELPKPCRKILYA